MTLLHQSEELMIPPDENKSSPLINTPRLLNCPKCIPTTDTTTLLQAIRNKNTELANNLIDSDVNIDLDFRDQQGECAINLTAKYGMYKTTKHLAKAQANLDLYNWKHTTPLMRSIQKEHYDLATYLVIARADVNYFDNSGNSALLIGTRQGIPTSLLSALISHKANINLKCKEGNTPIILASLHGHTNSVDLLIKSNAQLDICNNYSNTALILAVWKGHCDIVKLLIQGKASMSVRDEDGHTPLLVAGIHGQSDIAKYLLNSNSDIGVMNYRGKFVIDLTIDPVLRRYLFKQLYESSRTLLAKYFSSPNVILDCENVNFLNFVMDYIYDPVPYI